MGDDVIRRNPSRPLALVVSVAGWRQSAIRPRSTRHWRGSSIIPSERFLQSCTLNAATGLYARISRLLERHGKQAVQ